MGLLGATAMLASAGTSLLPAAGVLVVGGVVGGWTYLHRRRRYRDEETAAVCDPDPARRLAALRMLSRKRWATYEPLLRWRLTVEEVPTVRDGLEDLLVHGRGLVGLPGHSAFDRSWWRPASDGPAQGGDPD